MSTTIARDVSTKLLLLRDLDSVIDFSRASNQFTIVLYLAEQREPVSVSELVRVIGDSRKSILDSLRKLEKKGLIDKLEKNGELFIVLSDHGREFVQKLIELLSPLGLPRGEVLDTPVRLNISKELIMSINLYRLIVHAGLSRKGYITLEEASRLVIDGERSVNVLVESFTNPPTRFFRVAKKGEKSILVLDKQGLEVLKKTPHCKVFQKNPLYRVAVILTGSPWLREIVGRLNVILGALNLLSITGALLFKNTVFLLIGVGASALIVGLNLVFTGFRFFDAD